MLEILLQKWSSSSFSQKLQIIKSAILQLILLGAFSLMLFWGMFFAIWIISMIIGVQPYYQVLKPNFHVRALMPSNLVVTYVNYDIKDQVCKMGEQQDLFGQLTVPYHQYCNIEQETLPRMRAPVDITLYYIDNSKISYITGCIKHKGKAVSCQKYQSSSELFLFRHLQFYNLYYMQIELHLRDSSQSPAYSPQVEFEERTWLINKIIKKYYNIFTFVFTFGITGLLTISVVILRLVKLARKELEKNEESKQLQNRLSSIGKRSVGKKQNGEQNKKKLSQKNSQKQKQTSQLKIENGKQIKTINKNEQKQIHMINQNQNKKQS